MAPYGGVLRWNLTSYVALGAREIYENLDRNMNKWNHSTFLYSYVLYSEIMAPHGGLHFEGSTMCTTK